ncbi:MAG TPA: hypothetical protein DEB50_10070 [Desulfobacter sp.]|nr:hypothetical protein [Desulfobacter sp.]
MTKPEFNEVNSITEKRCHKVCPVGMTGRVALVLINMGKPPALPGRLSEFDICGKNRKPPLM